MGGNVFQNVCRLDKDDYFRFSSEIMDKLFKMSLDGNQTFVEISYYSEKPSFGDMDILHTGIKPLDIDSIAKIFNTEFFSKNGPVVSFSVPVKFLAEKWFQIDIITVPSIDFKFAYSYFSFNDLGNFIGKVAHRLGFSLGQHGLKYIVREKGNSSHVLKELFVSKDWGKSLHFLGYNPLVWNKGFKQQEETFSFAITSPFAIANVFDLNLQSHVSRTRDRKRTSYKKFLEWIRNCDYIIDEYPIGKERLREIALLTAFEWFPEFKKEYFKAQENAEVNRKSKQLFNGNIVGELTGLSGSDLGKFITNFKKSVSGDFNFWVNEQTEKNINDSILKFFNSEINEVRKLAKQSAANIVSFEQKGNRK